MTECTRKNVTLTPLLDMLWYSIEPNLQDIIFTPITRIGSRFDHSETQKIDIFVLDPLEREVCGGIFKPYASLIIVLGVLHLQSR